MINNDSFFTFSFVEQGIFSNKCRDDLRMGKIGPFAPVQYKQYVPNAKMPILKAALLCTRKNGKIILALLDPSWKNLGATLEMRPLLCRPLTLKMTQKTTTL